MSGLSEGSALKVREDRLNVIFDIVAGLYHDKGAAVIRELAANGRDATQRAGRNDPVEITLPNELNPSLIVRDHGIGMSFETLVSVYLTLVDTDKEGSDDEMGTYGIGSKSVLSVADSLVVESVRDGLRSSLMIYLDEHSVPRHQIIARELATSESNGTTITAAIRDIDLVRGGVATLWSWPAGSVVVDGTPIGDGITDGGWVRVGDDLYMRDRRFQESRALVLSGTIAYQMTPAQEALLPNSSMRFLLVDSDLEVMPHVSREQVKETLSNENWIKHRISALGDFNTRYLEITSRGRPLIENVTRALKVRSVVANDPDDPSWSICHDGLTYERASLEASQIIRHHVHGGGLSSRPVLSPENLAPFFARNGRKAESLVVITGLDAATSRDRSVRRRIWRWLRSRYNQVYVLTTPHTSGMNTWLDLDAPDVTLDDLPADTYEPAIRPTGEDARRIHRVRVGNCDQMWTTDELVDAHASGRLELSSAPGCSRALDVAYVPTYVSRTRKLGKRVATALGLREDSELIHVSTVLARQRDAWAASLSPDDQVAAWLASKIHGLQARPSDHPIVVRAIELSSEGHRSPQVDLSNYPMLDLGSVHLLIRAGLDTVSDYLYLVDAARKA